MILSKNKLLFIFSLSLYNYYSIAGSIPNNLNNTIIPSSISSPDPMYDDIISPNGPIVSKDELEHTKKHVTIL